jgi:hypothetical protein
MAAAFESSIIIRGREITDNLVRFGGRGEDVSFLSPDPHQYVTQLPLGDPGRMADLHELSFEDILAYLGELGSRLVLSRNTHLKEAMASTVAASPLTAPLVKAQYESLARVFDPSRIREMAEGQVGIDYLEGWVERVQRDGKVTAVRAFGSRAVHIVAGNSPSLSGLTIIRNAITRSDAIIKSPSNDPLTALAIARTMIEMAPDHPLTRHLSVVYWKGGDEAFEERLYKPANVEKIIAWGGYASVKHVTRYIRPGLELISLDPKRSVSIVGPQIRADPALRGEAALRVAADVGGLNQVGCANARVVYVLCGTDEPGLECVNALGREVYAALLSLPENISTKPKRMDAELKRSLASLRMDDEWFQVIGGQQEEGAVIVSQLSDPVEFATMLADRVVNLVPIDNLESVLVRVDAYTQTVGIFPEILKTEVADKLALSGAQRLVSLGYAMHGSLAGPQDGIEPLRRMCKWILDEYSDPAIVAPPWLGGESSRQSRNLSAGELSRSKRDHDAVRNSSRPIHLN